MPKMSLLLKNVNFKGENMLTVSKNLAPHPRNHKPGPDYEAVHPKSATRQNLHRQLPHYLDVIFVNRNRSHHKA